MIKVIVVDDEKDALEMMGELLRDINGIELVALLSNPNSAIEFVKNNIIDAVFLDMDMSYINGLEVAREMKRINSEIQIIFVTAYRDYAVDAFELNSIDYILKPVLKKRILTSVERLKVLRKPAPRCKIYVKCFGSFETFDACKSAIKWRTAKEKELWAYLVMSQGAFLERDIIIEDIWRNSNYEKGKAYLHTCLSYLRKDLKAVGASNDIIIKENNGYKLRVDEVDSDLYQFINIISHNQRVNTDNIEHYEHAIAIFSQGLYANEGYYWAARMSYRLEKDYLRILDYVTKFHQQKHNYHKLKHYFEKILQISPYSDKHCRNLMQVYTELGDRSSAIKLYQQFITKLETDMEISPEKETVLLYKQIKGCQ